VASTASRTGPTGSHWLAALAVVVLLVHAAAAVGIYLATSVAPSDAPARLAAPVPARGADTADAVALPLPSPVVSAPPAQPELPLEVVSEPPVAQTEPVVPLPDDRDERTTTLVDVRNRRMQTMLRQQNERSAP
jgi:hypothetical protein